MNPEIIEKIKELLANEETGAQIADVLKIDSFKDFLHGFAVIWEILQKVAAVVEYIWSEVGEIDKKDRIAYAAAALDDMIKFPFWLEPFDKRLFMVGISAAVQSLNKLFKTKVPTETSPTNLDLTNIAASFKLPIGFVL